MRSFFTQFISPLNLLLILISLLLISCSSNRSDNDFKTNLIEEDFGKQYLDGELPQDLTPRHIHKMITLDLRDFNRQLAIIKQYSPNLYSKNRAVYEKIEQLTHNGQFDKIILNDIDQLNLTALQLSGSDRFGNVLLTSYYTPVMDANKSKTKRFRHPLYAKPHGKVKKIPSRESIYNGALENLGLEVAYTESIIDNFFFEIQGSGYVKFTDEEDLVLLSYHAQNGFPYTPVGRLLVDDEILTKEEVSLATIKQWALKQKEADLKKYLAQNQSSVFFQLKRGASVKGAAGIPLVGNAAIATDRNLIPTGSIVLIDMPLLNEQGHYTGQREFKLMVALDVGGAIKRHHLDIYQGIGKEAGKKAGFYKHFGRVWVITDNESDLIKK